MQVFTATRNAAGVAGGSPVHGVVAAAGADDEHVLRRHVHNHLSMVVFLHLGEPRSRRIQHYRIAARRMSLVGHLLQFEVVSDYSETVVQGSQDFVDV